MAINATVKETTQQTAVPVVQFGERDQENADNHDETDGAFAEEAVMRAYSR
jgi:hypothetical protein